MPINREKKLRRAERLQKMLEFVNADTLTLAEAKRLVDVLIKKVDTTQSKIKNEYTKQKQDLKDDYIKEKEKLKKELDKAVSLLKKAEESFNVTNTQTKGAVREVKPLIRQAFREIDDLKKDIENIPDTLEYITKEEVEELLPETSNVDTIASALEKRMNEKLKNLEKRVAKGFERVPRGGGTSSIGVAQAFKWIAHTEQPVGDIDGVNTTYTVKNNIWWIAGFTLNGEQIAELPNFTYVNKTITFSTAIPAAFSGKDFEVKYIGS